MSQDSATCITKDLLKNAAPIMFGLIIISGFFYVLYSLLTHEYPSANKDQINSLIEFLKNAALIVVGFFFGSSASNKTKDETISAIAQSAPGTGNGGAAPISIPGAQEVSVKTETGDVNIPTNPQGG